LFILLDGLTRVSRSNRKASLIYCFSLKRTDSPVKQAGEVLQGFAINPLEPGLFRGSQWKPGHNPIWAGQQRQAEVDFKQDLARDKLDGLFLNVLSFD
jgi:hypothetical protein